MDTAAQRVMNRCRELAAVTDVAGETTRTFLSPAMRRCNDLVGAWMRDAGMEVSVDAAGNLRGVLAGTSAKKLVIASHLDTVINAGAYDGPLGVIMAIELAAIARERSLPFSMEVIGFSEEEGVRFGVPFIGSRAVVGTLDASLLAKTDAEGTSVKEAIAAYGLDSAALDAAKLCDAFAYFEIHIEQGPLLESEDRSLGVVTAIAGQSRYLLTFLGKANHAGTTPMHLRQDAMAAAAAWIVRMEEVAIKTEGLVATVGKVETFPGAGNVIAGEVRVTLDARSADNSVRTNAVHTLLKIAEECCEQRGVMFRNELKMDQKAIPMDATLTALLVEAAGNEVPQIVSGAGHDAMIVAPHLPSAMLFLRSPDGLSHHPGESVRKEDVTAALEAGARFLDLLAARRT